MHGREGEERKRRRGMLPVHAPGTQAAATTPSSSPQRPLVHHPGSNRNGHHHSPDSFVKDGRKIRIGDCALFQSGDSPPFIGIIRWISLSKEGYLKLCVNWLYRPSDVKLAKGFLLEVAPNEVFYSFHKDEISAESLLHPCRVAFLRKGVELPPGVSSFVCRRVYDIANKCLWWLTDQDYINERQEEVDKLLDRTQLEMHTAVQPGGRSPKQLNGPTSAQQLKAGSDSVQNSGSAVPSQGKGKKREKVDQILDSVRRDRIPKADDGDSGNFKLDSTIKAEISKITDRGGLVDAEGVDKLLNLMQLDKVDKKIDLSARVLLADVIASTDRFDCLNRFVQLKGVLVLHDWLQEVHKGKTGDGNSPKEGDKSVEELLLALLRALDKLPVNLHALQTSNIGKSVNHLRTHKNSEIQKKARHLVDTWKKRVDAEMSKTNDTKSASLVTWSGKPGLSDSSHGINRRTASSEAGLKNSVNQPSSCKSLPAKPGHGDIKSTSLMSGSSKTLSTGPSAAICSKDAQCKPTATSGTAEMLLVAIKEEKSSGSSQSQNNSQSCSSDQAKNVGISWKEDARTSTAGSTSSGKASGGTSRHRKSNNGFIGTGGTGVHKDTTFGKSLSHQNRSISQSGASGERSSDLPVGDTGNSQRLIVRLPNPGRSPAGSVTGGSVEEPSFIGSRASSPVSSEKHDQGDRKLKVKGDAWRANSTADLNVESMHANCVKGEADFDDAGRSSGAPDEEQRNMPGKGKVEDAPKASYSSFTNEKNHALAESTPGNIHDPSFGSINALIESCVQYSEDKPKASLSAGDDVGMNLLASVATAEMPKAEPDSPAASPLRKTPACDEISPICETKPKASFDNIAGKDSLKCDSRISVEIESHSSSVSTLVVEQLKQSGAETMADLSDNGKETVNSLMVKSSGEDKDVHTKLEKKAKEAVDPGESTLTSLEDNKEVSPVSDRNNRLLGKKRAVGEISDSLINGNHKVSTPSDESKPPDSVLGKIAETNTPASNFGCSSSGIGGDPFFASSDKLSQKKTDESRSCSPLDMDVNKTDKVNEVLSIAAPIEKYQNSTAAESNESKRGEHATAVCVLQSQLNVVDRRKDGDDGVSASSDVCDEPPSVPMREPELGESSMDIKSSGIAADEAMNMESCEAASLCNNLTEPDSSVKCVFDLNEGVTGDEGNIAETTTAAPLGSSSAACLPSFLPFTISPISSGSPVAITVAAPAKGPFMPPEDLLKSKSEPGWKGSAATSAFRPAEPRKVLELPLNAPDVSSDSAASKQSRLPLNIDLNVPDERALQDMPSQSPAPEVGSGAVNLDSCHVQGRSSGGLNLDLNRADGDTECGHFSASTNRRLEAPNLLGRPAYGEFPNGEATSLREFDLNNGPGLEEASVEPVTRNQHTKSSSSPFISSVGGLRMNSTELGSLQPWFPAASAPGNSYPAVAIPPFLPDRGDHSYPLVASAGAQRCHGSATATGSFDSDYRGSMLSSPAMAFPPYANLPFGPGFSLPSTSFSGMPTAYMDSSSIGGSGFPTVPSQLAGLANAASPAYVRPILISLPESSASGSGSESNRKWGRQGLDLNAGPGGTDVEGRDERLSSSRQHFVAISQAFADEQTRMFQIAGGGLKRKEPEGGWDAERFSYRQPSLQ